jgi:hypothetical protein
MGRNASILLLILRACVSRCLASKFGVVVNSNAEIVLPKSTSSTSRQVCLENSVMVMYFPVGLNVILKPQLGSLSDNGVCIEIVSCCTGVGHLYRARPLVSEDICGFNLHILFDMENAKESKLIETSCSLDSRSVVTCSGSSLIMVLATRSISKSRGHSSYNAIQSLICLVSLAKALKKC